MSEYDHRKIEKKWQKIWEENRQDEVDEKSKKPKYYSLIEFPYPSGDGLHVGAVKPYTAMDIISRKRRRENFEVLYPIGFDAFGLPAENFAVKTGVHPRITTEKAINNFRKQLKSLGLSYDWSREVKTTDPKYYKWTQWIFLKLFENGLAYKEEIPINWCKDCKIGLANEEVVGGVCERCGGEIEKRSKAQWMLAITKYADRLLNDLELLDYIEPVKIQQRNWIGRSEGWEEYWQVDGMDLKLSTFTTWPHTTYGVTFIVLAPEHPLVMELVKKTEYETGALEFIKKTKKQSLVDRTNEEKEKEGYFTGRYAINHITGWKIPIYIANFAIMDYGTGIVKGCPAHDYRDFDFAIKYDLDIKVVIKPKDQDLDLGNLENAYVGGGVMINAGDFNGMDQKNAKFAIGKKIVSSGNGKETVNYKLRDWVFSRQRYWGEPIPMILCPKCGPTPIPEHDLPLELPEVEDFMPNDKGESPLAKATDWVNVKCPKCNEDAKRETDVMPNWAGSSWYFLRYIDPQNDNALVDKEKEKKWMPVDWYNGGMEHTTLHLLYSRFWHKFLYDIKVVNESEPYKKRTSHGLIIGEDGEKMSKSRGNIINPDDIVDRFGADTLRVYEMFMGPFDQAVNWSSDGLMGPRRFLDKLWRVSENLSDIDDNETLRHETIQKVTNDIEAMRFNTAISSMMVYLNEMNKEEAVSKADFKTLLLLLAPFAPHITEELWQKLGEKESIHLTPWPTYDKNKIVKDKHLIVVQVNGKVRGEVEVGDPSEEKVKEEALGLDRVRKYTEGKEIKKIIYIDKKLLNIVV